MAAGNAARTDAGDLRRRAEARLRDEPAAEALSPEAARKLVHELRTHQIELEMQNEELRRSQEELAESLARYSDLYDFAPVGYLTLDEDGSIHEANLTIAGMLGVERGHLVGRRLTGFVLAEDEGALRALCRRVLQEGVGAGCDCRMRHADGKTFWAAVEIGPVTQGGKITRLRCAVTDVTEHKRAEEMLHEAERLRALRDISAGVAHNFNNLLAGVLGYAEFVRAEMEAKGLPLESVDQLVVAAKRTVALAQRLRLCVEPASDAIEPVSLRELVTLLADLCRTGLPPNVEIVTDLGALDLRVCVSPDRLLAALRDLCVNGIEAMPSGGRLTLICGMDQHSSRAGRVARAVISVSDTGVGMHPEVKARIVTPFFSTKGRVGVGLSLAVARHVVEDYRGVIEFESAPGKGTTFHVRLPIAEAGPSSQGRADRG